MVEETQSVEGISKHMPCTVPTCVVIRAGETRCRSVRSSLREQLPRAKRVAGRDSLHRYR